MNNSIFMAIAKGKTTTEVEYKKYIGVGACTIAGVNLNKKELEALYGNTQEKDPEYVGEVEVTEGANKVKCANVRITFVAKPTLNNEVLSPINVTFFIQRRFKYNRDKTKVQVIDKYGRTAWVTIEQCKNHEIPMYSNGPANLDKDYRPAYVGEEDLTNFFINYLNIPAVMRYNQAENKWYLTNNPEDSECRLEHIEDYFKGDFSELKQAIALQPENKVKILFGVRTDSEGRQFQTAFTQMVLKNSVNDFTKLNKFVEERKNAGAYSTTEFKVVNLQEYTVESTPIEDTSSDLPFSSNNPWDM